VQVGSENNWASASAGNSFTVALKKNGTLWSWGINNLGQLGDNTVIMKSSPVQVFGSATDWASVSAGNTHAMALKTNGTLWGWGDNGNGKLGDGTTTERHFPVPVSSPPANNYASVSAGNTFTVALKGDGTLWAWGANSSGQLGIGTTPLEVFTPTSVTGINWSSVSAGASYTIALKTNGTLSAWGNNTNGQLGVGDNSARSTPTLLPGSNWAFVSAGSGHTIAVQNGGTLWAWGDNFFGQLGNGEPLPGTDVNPNPEEVTFFSNP
jgi:alpha-tubulin suppressor-like RCC1 family protein